MVYELLNDYNVLRYDTGNYKQLHGQAIHFGQLTFKMKELQLSETLRTIYQLTWHNIPEDFHLQLC